MLGLWHQMVSPQKVNVRNICRVFEVRKAITLWTWGFVADARGYLKKSVIACTIWKSIFEIINQQPFQVWRSWRSCYWHNYKRKILTRSVEFLFCSFPNNLLIRDANLVQTENQWRAWLSILEKGVLSIRVPALAKESPCDGTARWNVCSSCWSCQLIDYGIYSLFNYCASNRWVAVLKAGLKSICCEVSKKTVHLCTTLREHIQRTESQVAARWSIWRVINTWL